MFSKKKLVKNIFNKINNNLSLLLILWQDH
jgi:hypothetical protein